MEKKVQNGAVRPYGKGPAPKIPDIETLAKRYGTPLYAYDGEVIRACCEALKTHFPGADIYYACKANENRAILKIVRTFGFGIETVSRGEIELALICGFSPSAVSYTCHGAEEDELAFAIRSGVSVQADSLGQLETYGRLKPRSGVSMRLNLGIGEGANSYVSTGGPKSKFGILPSELHEAERIMRKYGLKLTGLHQHVGSNILSARAFLRAAEALFSAARRYPGLETVNVGGGLGVPYAPGERKLDMPKLSREMLGMFREYFAGPRPPKLALEPGRYIVAESGILLVRVTDVKRNGQGIFVSVNSGMNHLLRPGLYGSYHAIANASRPKEQESPVTISGNICEARRRLRAQQVHSSAAAG